MISFSTKALLLRALDVGEADRICTLLTEDRGKIDAVARGIRKAESKLASSVQPFLFLESYIIVQRRNTLGGSVIIDDYSSVRSDPMLWWAGCHVVELARKMTPQEHRDQQLFSLVRQALIILNGMQHVAASKILLFTASFDLHLLEHLGMLPSLFHCTHCKQDKADALHLRSDGLYCSGCIGGKPNHKITKQTRTLLRFAQQKSMHECLKVACSRDAAADAVRATRILLEDHDALPMVTDKASFALLQVAL